MIVAIAHIQKFLSSSSVALFRVSLQTDFGLTAIYLLYFMQLCVEKQDWESKFRSGKGDKWILEPDQIPTRKQCTHTMTYVLTIPACDPKLSGTIDLAKTATYWICVRTLCEIWQVFAVAGPGCWDTEKELSTGLPWCACAWAGKHCRHKSSELTRTGQQNNHQHPCACRCDTIHVVSRYCLENTYVSFSQMDQ